MFQESLVESSSLLRGRSRWPAVISVAVQATIATMLVVLPLLHPEILQVGAPKISLVAPRFLKPPVPVRMMHVETSSSVAVESAPAQLTQTTIFRDQGQAMEQQVLATGVSLAGTNDNPLATLGAAGPAGPHVVARPAAAAGPLHISSGVMAGALLTPIQPEYPAIAKISRTEGTVVVQAVISKTGRIESAHVVSGPAMLQAAALEAVREARYRPFLLNGLPTEVETTVNITFRLAN